MCPYLKENLTAQEQLDLLKLIFQLWQLNEENKIATQNIDWSVVGDLTVEEALGFHPKNSVHFEDYATELERLPDFVLEWLKENEEEKLTFLNDLGVHTEQSDFIRFN